MTKHVTRLYDYLKIQYTKNRNKYNRGNSLISFTSFNDDFMKQAVTHGDTFNITVDEELFYGVKKILSTNAYTQFRNDFMDRFLSRDIKFQTIDLFILHINAEVAVLKGMIEKVYDKEGYNELLNGVTKTTTVSEGTSTNTNIGTSTTLPQTSNDFSQIDYADNLDKNQGDSEDKGKSETISIKPTPETLQDLQDYHTKLFATLDQKLFSQLF